MAGVDAACSRAWAHDKAWARQLLAAAPQHKLAGGSAHGDMTSDQSSRYEGSIKAQPLWLAQQPAQTTSTRLGQTHARCQQAGAALIPALSRQHWSTHMPSRLARVRAAFCVGLPTLLPAKQLWRCSPHAGSRYRLGHQTMSAYLSVVAQPAAGSAGVVHGLPPVLCVCGPTQLRPRLPCSVLLASQALRSRLKCCLLSRRLFWNLSCRLCMHA